MQFFILPERTQNMLVKSRSSCWTNKYRFFLTKLFLCWIKRKISVEVTTKNKRENTSQVQTEAQVFINIFSFTFPNTECWILLHVSVKIMKINVYSSTFFATKYYYFFFIRQIVVVPWKFHNKKKGNKKSVQFTVCRFVRTLWHFHIEHKVVFLLKISFYIFCFRWCVFRGLNLSETVVFFCCTYCTP